MNEAIYQEACKSFSIIPGALMVCLLTSIPILPSLNVNSKKGFLECEDIYDKYCKCMYFREALLSAGYREEEFFFNQYHLYCKSIELPLDGDAIREWLLNIERLTNKPSL